MKNLLLIAGVFFLFEACHQNKQERVAVLPTAKCIPASPTTSGSPPANTYTLDGNRVSDAIKYVNYFQNSGNPDNFDQGLHYSVFYKARAIKSIYDAIPKTTCDGIRFYFGKTSRSDNHFMLIPVATLNGVPDPTCPDVKDHTDYFLTTSPGYAPSTPEGGPALPGSLFGINCPIGNDDCPQTTHYINCDDAKQFATYSKKEQMNATSEWFDAEVIKEMIDLIPTNGGIRFYFGKHSTAGNHDNIPRHGIIMMITERQKEQEVDTLICLPKDQGKHDLFKKLRKLYRLTGGGTNNGEECPTNCQGTKLP